MANNEKVQPSPAIVMGLRAVKSPNAGLVKYASAWKAGTSVRLPNSKPIIMMGLRPMRSESAPQTTMSGVPMINPTAKIVQLVL